MKNNDIKNNCMKIFNDTNDIEYVLTYLRDNGYSKVQSMQILIELQKIDLDEAKRIVHLSKVWADTYSRDENIHDAIKKVLEKRKKRTRN